MSRNSSFTPIVLALLLVASTALHARAGEDNKLRYRWKTGDNPMYHVTVEADHGDYLDVMTGHPGFTVTGANADGITVTFRGALSRKQQLKPGVKGIIMPRPSSPFSPFTGIGTVRSITMTINDRGEVITTTGTTQLPYLLGQLSDLMLETLPKENDKTWKSTQNLTITMSNSLFPRPTIARIEGKQTKATQETSYSIDTISNDTVILNKTVDLTTAETVGGKPRIEIHGQGKVTFDKKVGIATKLDFEQKMTFRDDGRTDDTPLKITYRLLSEQEKSDLAKTAEGAPLFPQQPLAENLQKQALEDLKSGEKSKQLRALIMLQNKEPEKTNKEIAAAAEELLTGGDSSLRHLAARTLGKWGTKDSHAALLKCLDEKEVILRHAAMESLGKLKSEAAAEPIAKRMSELQDRFQAAKALRLIGPVAEPSVIKLTEHADWQVRYEACKILGEVGAEKSVPTLTALQTTDENNLVRNTAKKALEEIGKRK